MRQHHFLPSYLTMPTCPMTCAHSPAAAINELWDCRGCHEARLIWLSPDHDVANHAMILELIPDLGVLTMRGITGSHSITFKVAADLPRAMVHLTGFIERCKLQAQADVARGMHAADFNRASRLIAELAVEIDRLRRQAEV